MITLNTEVNPEHLSRHPTKDVTDIFLKDSQEKRMMMKSFNISLQTSFPVKILVKYGLEKLLKMEKPISKTGKNETNHCPTYSQTKLNQSLQEIILTVTSILKANIRKF